jgi:uncharacterized protein (UPF0371 family)
MYQDLREKLATGIFAALVDSGNIRNNTTKKADDTAETSSRTHILKRAFEVFDEQKKGYVDEEDLERVMSKVISTPLSPKDQKEMITAVRKESYREKAAGLSLSDFSQLFSRLSHQHFPRGHFIYQAGDDGDAMVRQLLQFW